MVNFQNISKSYGDQLAVNAINFSVKENELFGLIGPDGAGKTTLFRILATLLLPDNGNVLFDGHDVVSDFKFVRKNIGYMPGEFSLYQDLSVRENLEFFATIFQTTIEENYELIEDIYEQLEPFAKRRAGALSGGMKQKLALSCALIHKPKLLVLDEPTTGVDAISRKEFWDMLKSLKAKGVTILVSTPYMDEAALCDRVALIQNGSILDIDGPKGIIEKFDRQLYKVSGSRLYDVLNILREQHGFSQVYPFGQVLHLYSKTKIDLQDLTDALHNKGYKDISINTGEPLVEDCFMNLMVKQDSRHE